MSSFCPTPTALNILCYVQICFGVGAFLANSLKNASCTVFYDCAQTCWTSFLFKWVGVFISEKKQILNIEIGVVSAVKILDHLNEN